jgi:hypothetical protein
MTNQATALIERVVTIQNDNQTRVVKAVDQVNFKPWEKKSISYARGRAAINSDCYNLYKDNVAGAKNFKQARKSIMVEFLGGKVEWKDNKKFVMFPDGSQARY